MRARLAQPTKGAARCRPSTLWIGSGTIVVGIAVSMTACESNPTSPSGSTSTPTVTVTANGISPQRVSIPINGRVRFVNNDTVNRPINSNPFPTHTDCPPINQVDLLTPGQSKMTGPLSLQGARGFHEHLSESDPDFISVILIDTTDAETPPIGY